MMLLLIRELHHDDQLSIEYKFEDGLSLTLHWLSAWMQTLMHVISTMTYVSYDEARKEF